MKPEVYRHKKTGGIYSVICNANIEKTGELAVVYRNEKNRVSGGCGLLLNLTTGDSSAFEWPNAK